ncbi:MAG: hypothetical protein H6617_10925 [Bdellovibrionaceae bacterium]|nr:hypothetical protein [Pseudobdellovibrionaceae bacterium]
MKAKVYASLLASVLICSSNVRCQEPTRGEVKPAPVLLPEAPPKPEAKAPAKPKVVEDPRSEEVRDLEKRLQALTNAVGNLQLTMVDVYCEQCPVTLKQQNRELAPYLHIAGRFSILRDGLFDARDSLQELKDLSSERKQSILAEVARFEARLKLSEASIKALEPGERNPLYGQVEKQLANVYAFFGPADSNPKTDTHEVLNADVRIMWDAAQHLTHSRLTTSRVKAQAEEVLKKLRTLSGRRGGEAEVYELLDRVFEQLQPNYLLIDQFGMDFSAFSNEQEEKVREAAVNLLGASELFAEHSRTWAQNEFSKRRKERLSQASAEAKADGDTSKSKVLALIFYNESKPFRPSASVVAALQNNAIGYLPESYLLSADDKTSSRLIDHPAFSVLKGKPGIVFINYIDPQHENYRRVVSYISADEWNDVKALKTAIRRASELSSN